MTMRLLGSGYLGINQAMALELSCLDDDPLQGLPELHRDPNSKTNNKHISYTAVWCFSCFVEFAKFSVECQSWDQGPAPLRQEVRGFPKGQSNPVAENPAVEAVRGPMSVVTGHWNHTEITPSEIVYWYRKWQVVSWFCLRFYVE